jgi:TonB-dependent SusC/RagA subfamily outer membrane receptor
MRLLFAIYALFACSLGFGQELTDTITIRQERSKIIIRCGGTIFPSGPLYVVDGKISDSLTASKISPSYIASMTILKGSEATALYGSQALHGVILVKTKTPMVVVDGIIRDYDFLKALDTTLIESIEVLKDASAPMLFSSRNFTSIIVVRLKCTSHPAL